MLTEKSLWVESEFPKVHHCSSSKCLLGEKTRFLGKASQPTILDVSVHVSIFQVWGKSWKNKNLVYVGIFQLI